jgi:hypothetical protein
MNATRTSDPVFPTIAVEGGGDRQVVRLVSPAGDVAAALRHSMGWTVTHGTTSHQAITLDQALAKLGWLPDPNHREGARL